MNDAKGSTRALTDPQYGLVQVLRPFPKFEDAYNGKRGNVPIMFNEDSEVLDERAGAPGYSSKLVNGLSVPMGARVQIDFPTAPANRLFGPYIWLICWRYSNTFDYRTQRRSYHYPRQGQGVAETGAGAGPRVVIPAKWEAVVVLGSGPRIMNKDTGTDLTASDFAMQQLSAEGIKLINNDFQFKGSAVSYGSISPAQPLIDVAGTKGVIQQGLFDYAEVVTTDFGMPSYMTYDTRAKGDEMLIMCVKDQTPLQDQGWKADWDLTHAGADWIFSLYFGQGDTTAGGAVRDPHQDVGVYVTIGVAP